MEVILCTSGRRSKCDYTTRATCLQRVVRSGNPRQAAPPRSRVLDTGMEGEPRDRILSGNVRFLGICFSCFLKKETGEVGSGKGSWASFCPDLPGFSVFGGYGRVEGLDGVSPSAGAWFGGWVVEVAGFVLRDASFSNSKTFQRSERRLSFRLCDPGEPPQPEVAGGSGRRVLSRGHAARLSRAAMVLDCARSPSRWMSTFESRPKTRLRGHPLLCDSRR